jgi:hypothetical protein
MAAKRPVAKKAGAVKQPVAKKAVAKKAVAKKAVAKRAVAKGAAAKTAAMKEAASRAHGRREDLGAPAAAYFAGQSDAMRALLAPLRALSRQAVPGARESIEWGMPHDEQGSGFCALSTSRSYVSLILMAPPAKPVDPQGRLEGSGKTMRHLKVRSAADIDEAAVVGWLRTAARAG